MVKHNNMLPNGHFHKDWQRYVKTWFNQPARKQRRHDARSSKASENAPTPLKAFRPIVSKQTLRYAAKTKSGRGFNQDELKRAGLTPAFSRTIGIKVDLRRTSKSAETLQTNVQRLELYKSKIALIPLKQGKPKKGQIHDAVKA